MINIIMQHHPTKKRKLNWASCILFTVLTVGMIVGYIITGAAHVRIDELIKQNAELQLYNEMQDQVMMRIIKDHYKGNFPKYTECVEAIEGGSDINGYN